MIRTNSKPSFRSRSSHHAALLAERPRVLRFSLTSTEELLWHRIGGRRMGVALRGQVPLLGRFIADFVAPTQRLVIELDGAYHGDRSGADARRDAALQRAGYRVLRRDASLIVAISRALFVAFRPRFAGSLFARPSGFEPLPYGSGASKVG